MADPVPASMAFTSRYGHHPALRDYNGIQEFFLGEDHIAPIVQYIFDWLVVRHGMENATTHAS
jgi:hypothetical protein